jgi:hypothetical protein
VAALGFWQRLGRGQKEAASVWRKTLGGAARLIKARSPPWRAGHARERVPEADSGGGAVGLGRVWPGHDAGKGMAGGPHLSSAAGAGEQGLAVGGAETGPAGPHGCAGLRFSAPGRREGGAPADFQLMGHKQTRARREGRLRG